MVYEYSLGSTYRSTGILLQNLVGSGKEDLSMNLGKS